MSIKKVSLDPRTKILLILLANIIAFSQNSIFIELSFNLFLFILGIIFRCEKRIVKIALLYVTILLLQYALFPLIKETFFSSFIIFIAYMRKIFPCVITGTILIQTTSTREIMVGLRTFRIPEKVIIALAVTLRYFSGIKEELNKIREAIKMRGIRGTKKVEYYIIPILFSAAATSDELSAAAVSRGIENPGKKTTIIQMKWHIQDICCLVIGIFFIILAFLKK